MNIDTNLIKQQVKRVVSWSQGIDEPQVDELIDRWKKAKDRIMWYLGGPIWMSREPVTVTISEEDKDKKIHDFCDYIELNFPSLSSSGLVSFIIENKEDFYNNILSHDYNLNDIHIRKGIKLTKAYKKFISDLDDLNTIQQKASTYIQEGKVTGYLCLSVHPLDYLSSSENCEDWRSCHALNGDYRSGNLAYMLDKSTIVCYLCDGKFDHNLPRFPLTVPWNSKRWRMLMYLSDDWDAIFAGRGYPFFSYELMDQAKKIWENLAMRGTLSEFHNDYFQKIAFKNYQYDNFCTEDRYVPLGHKIYNMKDLVTDYRSKGSLAALFYDDLLYSTLYVPYYCWDTGIHNKTIHFTIGADVPCLECGKHSLTQSDRMLCDDCLMEDENYVKCADCGRLINMDEAIYVHGLDNYICEDCYSSDYATCHCCGDVYCINDMVYDERTCEWYCNDCWESMQEDKY